MSASTNKTPSTSAKCWAAPAVCVVLAAITFAVFGQTLRHGFIDFDDNDYVYANPVVAQGLTLKGIIWAFAQPHAGNWHPLTWLSHMLDCQLYGLHPGGHHLTSVLIHATTVIVLFLVLREMTGALWRSAFVAAVFAIHPLRVESVAWVAERKDVLSGLFFMLTIGAYVRYARRPWSWGRYGLVVLLFVLGLMSKPMLVTLPLVLLLLDYWPLQRKEAAGKLVLEKLPLLALSAAGCATTILGQTEIIQLTRSFSLPLRIANAVTACMVYLGQMIFPAGLTPYYTYPLDGLPAWEVALAGALLAGLSVVALWQRRKQPWLLMGWLWYLVMLLPVLGIIQVGRQAHADRYTYLPQIGIYVAVTWLVAGWIGRRLAAGLMTGVIAVLMFCAWQQTTYWQNSETLWTRTLACTTNNELAHYAFANDLYERGRLDEAIAQYQTALQIRPDYVEAHYNLGTALYDKGSVDEAIAQFQQALQFRPRSEEAHNNLGIALLQKGSLDEAITHFQAALQIKPGFASPQLNLGIAYFRKGNLDEAIDNFQKALQIKPAYAAAHYNLGNALYQKGRTAEAISHYQQALQINPIDPEVLNNLAWLLAACAEPALRNGSQAVELARKANILTGGGNPLILHTLAAAFAEARQFADAQRTAQKAIELARSGGQQDLVEQLSGELKRYEVGLPLHESKK
jgi:protein O-mannosyl-transferase